MVSSGGGAAFTLDTRRLDVEAILDFGSGIQPTTATQTLLNYYVILLCGSAILLGSNLNS